MDTKHDFTITLYKNSGNSVDITELVNGITWSGDYQQVSRKLDFDVLYPIHDKNHPVVIPDVGDTVVMRYNGAEKFRGVVWSRNLSSRDQFVKISCFDALIYINKSYVSYNFKEMTAEAITSQIAQDLGVPVGSLAATGVTMNLPAIHQVAYDVIMQAYTKASKQTGKVYMPIIQNGSLNVIEKGTTQVGVTLDYDYNIEGTQFTETLDGLVSRVIVYDEKGNIVNAVDNSGWISAFGIIQDAIQVEKNKDMAIEAKNALKPVEQKANVDALGVIDAITGSAVTVVDKHTGLQGLFYIDGDSHTYINHVYEMKLTIAFKNIMDQKTVSEPDNSDGSGADDGEKNKIDTSWLDNWEVDADGNPIFKN